MMSDVQISVGDLSSFLIYAGFVGTSFRGLSSSYSEVMKGIGASCQLWQLIDRETAIPLTGKYWTFCQPLQWNLYLWAAPLIRTSLYCGHSPLSSKNSHSFSLKTTLYSTE